MGQALYRKYRPKSLKEVIGQEHITDTLSNAIAAGKISHAYLLTGPRGVGKTSIARILAHEVNGLTYEDLISHLDIIEIDAASNRRIDEIRELRDKVNILPTNAKYKVYIIDEVHMMTREAFNALLKTLEEPPAHAIFVLATTEAHKLPETIVSRTQHFSFKPIKADVLFKHLKSIAKSEKIKISDDALNLIAEHGDGSFRDSISLLDQAKSLNDDINLQNVQQLLGIAPAKAIENLLEVLISGNPKELFNSLHDMREQGLQSAIIAKQLSQSLRNTILTDPNFQSLSSTKLLYDLLEIPASSQPDRKLEIVLLEYIFSNSPKDAQIQTVKGQKVNTDNFVEEKTSVIPAPSPKPAIKQKKSENKNDSTEQNESKNVDTADEKISFTIEVWPMIVAQVKKTNNTLYGILRMAEANFENDVLTLSFNFAFHQKQINESKNRKIIEDIIQAQTGDNIKLVCIVSKKEKKIKKIDPNAGIDTVSNIFGGGEVLESGI